MERVKMSRQDRAKQFAPFDALKGLHLALKMKEFEHERVQKGDLSEEKILDISNILQSLKKNDKVRVTYFENGHNFDTFGACIFDVENQCLVVGHKKIPLLSVLDIEIID